MPFQEILEKMETENICLDENTFIGKANILKYLEQDERNYLEYLKNSFAEGTVDEEYKSEYAAQFLKIGTNPLYRTEVFEFIDQIESYQIPLNETIAELLYEIIVNNKNLDTAIIYFTRFLEWTEKEKRKLVLAKLVNLYEKSLAVGAQFHIENALFQVWEYFQVRPSMQARICYIWLLLAAERKEEAEELLALIPDDMKFSANQQEILELILEQYFQGKLPNIEEFFENKVKNHTFLQIAEDCKKYKDFVIFSKEEEKIHTELIKNNQYRVEAKNLVAKRAVIKTIYEATMQYKSWYRYLLCTKKTDEFLNYCINLNLTLINLDVTNDKADKQLSFLIRNDMEARKKYAQYKLYNELSKLYLRKEYKKKSSCSFKISGIGKRQEVFLSV